VPPIVSRIVIAIGQLPTDSFGAVAGVTRPGFGCRQLPRVVVTQGSYRHSAGSVGQGPSAVHSLEDRLSLVALTVEKSGARLTAVRMRHIFQ